MRNRLILAVLLLALMGWPAATTAQDAEWTCDDGPNDALNAAQDAYDAGDLPTALELATEAEALCAMNIVRYQKALSLKSKVEIDLERQEIDAMLDAATPGMVDLGAYHLFMTCEGEGSPVVIFEHGLDGGIAAWDKVQPAVAKFTRACSYDRLGVGFSGDLPNNTVRTSQDHVDDLVALLQLAEIPGPYVLVGHSIAGFSLLLMADQYPDMVAGLVMVDVSHPNQVNVYNVNTGPMGQERVDFHASAAQAAEVGALGDLPLVVLTAGNDSRNADPEAWMELQIDLALRSTNSQHLVAVTSGHEIMNSEPEMVISATEWVVEQVRAQMEE